MKIQFSLPRWLWFLLPAKLVDDHDERIKLTGRASTSFPLPKPLAGDVTITTEKPQQ